MGDNVIPGKSGVKAVGDQVSCCQLLLRHGCSLWRNKGVVFSLCRLTLTKHTDLVKHGRVDVPGHVVVLEVDERVGV